MSNKKEKKVTWEDLGRPNMQEKVKNKEKISKINIENVKEALKTIYFYNFIFPQPSPMVYKNINNFIIFQNIASERQERINGDEFSYCLDLVQSIYSFLRLLKEEKQQLYSYMQDIKYLALGQKISLIEKSKIKDNQIEAFNQLCDSYTLLLSEVEAITETMTIIFKLLEFDKVVIKDLVNNYNMQSITKLEEIKEMNLVEHLNNDNMKNRLYEQLNNNFIKTIKLLENQKIDMDIEEQNIYNTNLKTIQILNKKFIDNLLQEHLKLVGLPKKKVYEKFKKALFYYTEPNELYDDLFLFANTTRDYYSEQILLKGVLNNAPTN